LDMMQPIVSPSVTATAWSVERISDNPR
jgi:hypothetical protein